MMHSTHRRHSTDFTCAFKWLLNNVPVCCIATKSKNVQKWMRKFLSRCSGSFCSCILLNQVTTWIGEPKQEREPLILCYNFWFATGKNMTMSPGQKAPSLASWRKFWKHKLKSPVETHPLDQLIVHSIPALSCSSFMLCDSYFLYH